MPFGRIPRFSPSFSPQEALLSARYLMRDGDDDEVVAKFEREFRSYIGAKHAVMVPSARYGLYLLLEALGIGDGDEVVIPALTYYAVPAMVPLLGAKPVFADIGLTSHVLDPAAFEAAITPKTKAVVPTHLFGTPCDMDAIRAIARKHGVLVIEDCAQSTGARYKGVRVGNLGDAAYYTFGLTKNMTTLSGAMITTDRDDVAEKVRATIKAGGRTDKAKLRKEAVTGFAMFLATHPKIYWAALHPVIALGNKLGDDPIHERFGEPEHRYDEVPASFRSKSQATAVQAAVGLKQLERLESLNGARIRNGRRLDEGLAHVPGLTVPTYPEGAEPIYMSFVCHHHDRQGLAAALRSRGVDTTIGYMSDCSSNPIFSEFAADCPNAREAFETLIHIPVHPNLRPKDLAHMIEATRQACLEVGGG
ncbi:MAG: DegT/DnrJ/EryC1/StrS family aminotransferase [Alphaproteobacteria bacterium]|nr:DegT/DnrJ/EryC1/StrS family aminotransferase [Alphaproteobacteria bacterium]